MAAVEDKIASIYEGSRIPSRVPTILDVPAGAAGQRGRPPGQLRPEPSVDARRPPPHRRPRRRAGRRPRGGDRLPPHRLREDDGAEDVVEVRDVPGADRLRRLPEQRARLRLRGRAAARAGGAEEGEVDAHAALRAQPDPLASRVSRHVGARAGSDFDVLVLLPRARDDPRPVRDRHRPARCTRATSRSAASRRTSRRASTREARKFVEWMPHALDDYPGSSTATRSGSSGRGAIGMLSGHDAIALGQTGPNLRASGVNWDLRRDAAVPPTTRSTSTCRSTPAATSRPLPRAHERDGGVDAASTRRCLRPASAHRRQPWIADDRKVVLPPARSSTRRWSRSSTTSRSSPGLPRTRRQIYVAIESPRGESGCYLVSDGGPKPWRVHFRAPSFVALEATATCVARLATSPT